MHMKSSGAGDVDSLLLSLSGKELSFHTFPLKERQTGDDMRQSGPSKHGKYERKQYLDQRQASRVLDFEHYSKTAKLTKNKKTV